MIFGKGGDGCGVFHWCLFRLPCRIINGRPLSRIGRSPISPDFEQGEPPSPSPPVAEKKMVKLVGGSLSSRARAGRATMPWIGML